MFDSFLEIIAPHRCYLCQKKGQILCNSCMYDISYDTFNACIVCDVPTVSGVCPLHRSSLPFSNAWVIGKRQAHLKVILHDFKFSRVYAAHKPLAQLLDITLPILPPETIVVPIPTITRHIRMRGYDHAALLAKTFAHHRGLPYKALLKRCTNSVQVGANKSQRERQAKEAFRSPYALDKTSPYLIVDDIITTGSTVKEAARILQQAGAATVMVAAIAR